MTTLERTQSDEKHPDQKPFLVLQTQSSKSWLNRVLDNFDAFLLDHAACEKKASSMAMSLIAHYPDKPKLVQSMADLAVEELVHFRQVTALILARGLTLGNDVKDPYIKQLKSHIKQGRDWFLLDQLLIAAVVEARGHERFSMISDCLTDPKLKRFYQAIALSESKHYELFLDLALAYFPANQVGCRLEQWLSIESRVIETLPLSPALH